MPRRIAISSPRERAASAIVAGGVVALVGWALVLGLSVHGRSVVTDALESFAVAPIAPPPPKPEPPPLRPIKHRPKNAAAPPNLRATPTEIVAPKPVLPPPPQPVAAAPIASTGTAPSAGAADFAGAGTGAGGEGNGLGGGGDGDGGSPATLISRDLALRDLPDAVLRTSFGGTVYFTFTVGTDGRVHDCRVDRSIGIPVVDTATCRAAEAHLRYRPERDRFGRKIPVTIRGEQRWDNVRREEVDDDR